MSQSDGQSEEVACPPRKPEFTDVLSSALEKKPDTTLPEQTMMGQNLKDLDIEICPDKLHLCPGTAECCKKDDGKWDCCPKAAVPIAGDCCHQLGFIWTCCTPSCSQVPLVGMLVDIEKLRFDRLCIYDFKCKKASGLAVFMTFL
ncbi:uncharacterized protein TNCV_1972601 [Trichonephila clavipes]|nr:uncharacterized protein TNCV_1972601 [Trichonephila clavipes]